MKKVNSNIEILDDKIIVSINPLLYPLGAVYSAAYVFLDKAYILLDGDPKSEIIVELKPKQKMKKQEKLERLGREFNNELINYSDYEKRAEKTQKIKELILQRALITNSLQPAEQNRTETQDEFDKIIADIETENSSYLEDPEGIAVPWEEKYGKKASKEDLKQANGKFKER